ncbi:MAG: response regulator transcription factor [Chitinophagaceae bacterium]
MVSEPQIIKIVLIDDHVLLRTALARLISSFENCEVILDASNGKDLINKLNPSNLPDVALLDLNMPIMDGFETAEWLSKNYPSIRILMLTMYESDLGMIRLLQLGVKGFLKKDIETAELNQAIRSVMQTGYYYSQHASGKLANLFRNTNVNMLQLEKAMLTAQEISFLKLASSDLTYKEIAMHMKLNPRAVDNIRDTLFIKLEVKSRVGLAMFAIRQGIVAL